MDNNITEHYTSNDDPMKKNEGKAASVRGAESGNTRYDTATKEINTCSDDTTETNQTRLEDERGIAAKTISEKQSNSIYSPLFYCFIGGIILLIALLGIALHKIDLLDRELTEIEHRAELESQASDMRDNVYQEKLNSISNKVDEINEKISNLGISVYTDPYSSNEWIDAEPELGNIDHGWLCINIYDIDPSLFDIEVPMGAYVESVDEGGAADKAGLQPYDAIVGFNGSQITCVNDLLEAITHTVPGEKVKIEIMRPGETSFEPMTLEVTMSENPNPDKR